MPLTKLELKPGINREVTTLAGKGGWYDCDKIRFRSGYPEKLGGWLPTSAVAEPFLGVGRTLINWVTLANADLLGIGTNLKYYIERGGVYNDVTPLRATETVTTNAFTSTTGSAVLVVNDTAHSANSGDFVTIATRPPRTGSPTTAYGKYRIPDRNLVLQHSITCCLVCGGFASRHDRVCICIDTGYGVVAINLTTLDTAHVYVD